MKKLSIITGTLLLLLGLFLGNYEQVKQTLGYATLREDGACKTAAATTTLSWMTPGTATTTVSCQTESSNSLRLNLIVVASSTLTRPAFRVERSMDNINWFPDVAELNELATTSILTQEFKEYSLRIASSTGGTSGEVAFNGTGTTTYSALNFGIPTVGEKYTRVKIYLQPRSDTASSTNGAVWAQIVASEEHK